MAACFLRESKGNQRTRETARVHSLLLILEVTLALAQLRDSKWMLLDGGCQKLLQMLMRSFPETRAAKSSDLDILEKQRLQRFQDYSQGLCQAWLSLQALGRILSSFSQLLVAVSNPWHALA